MRSTQRNFRRYLGSLRPWSCSHVLAAFLTLLAALPAQAERFVLRIGTGHPAGPSVYATELRDFFVPEATRRVAEETPHELAFIEAYGGSVAKVAETLEAVQYGVLDIGGYCVCFEPAKLFLHNFSYFVPFGPTDSEHAIDIAHAVYRSNPWLSAQLEERWGQALLALNGWDNYHLGTVEPWQTIRDLEGVKIGGAGPNLPWLAYVGAVPVQSSLPEGYMAMQTGVYSGWLMFPSAYYSYKFHEPAPHYTLVDFGAMGGAVVVTINNATLERLPASVRTILLSVARAYEEKAAAALSQRQAGGLERLLAAGADVRQLEAEQRQRWAESLKSFPNSMAREANARGMPGSQVLRSYIEIARERGHDWPVAYEIDPPPTN